MLAQDISTIVTDKNQIKIARKYTHTYEKGITSKSHEETTITMPIEKTRS